tara:strand:- start:97 stop:414 length:318 start_codon:yes stop_codon:yes gene_type:complete
MKKIILLGLFIWTINSFQAQIHHNYEQRELCMIDQLTKALESFSNVCPSKSIFYGVYGKKGCPYCYSKKAKPSYMYLWIINDNQLNIKNRISQTTNSYCSLRINT